MVKVLGLGDNVCDVYLHTNTMYPGGQAVNFAVFAKKGHTKLFAKLRKGIA